jgi:dienelactone hydrolase
MTRLFGFDHHGEYAGWRLDKLDLRREGGMKTVVTVALAMFLPACAGTRVAPPKEAVVRTETVDYRHEDVALSGYLAEPGNLDGWAPGVVIIHAWMGLGEFEKEQARRLAEMGYVAFCLDMYGKGVRPKNREEASEQATIYRSDRALLRARAAAGLAELKKNPRVDPSRVAAMGYCFGGGSALELARGGARLGGAVSFHGNLDTPDPTHAANIRAKILVLHGAADPVVPPEQVLAFQEEMSAADVDWQLVSYGGAVHGFTHVGSESYHPDAARRAWHAMSAFFEEIFAR